MKNEKSGVRDDKPYESGFTGHPQKKSEFKLFLKKLVFGFEEDRGFLKTLFLGKETKRKKIERLKSETQSIKKWVNLKKAGPKF